MVIKGSSLWHVELTTKNSSRPHSLKERFRPWNTHKIKYRIHEIRVNADILEVKQRRGSTAERSDDDDFPFVGTFHLCLIFHNILFLSVSTDTKTTPRLSFDPPKWHAALQLTPMSRHPAAAHIWFTIPDAHGVVISTSPPDRAPWRLTSSELCLKKQQLVVPAPRWFNSSTCWLRVIQEMIENWTLVKFV